jgi:hypothetical protein
MGENILQGKKIEFNAKIKQHNRIWEVSEFSLKS